MTSTTHERSSAEARASGVRRAQVWSIRCVTVILLGVGISLASGRLINPLALPSLGELWTRGVEMFHPSDRAAVYQPVLETGFHAVLGLLLGVFFGTAFALVVGRSRAGAIIEPYMAFASSLPRVALLPLIVLWVGSGLTTVLLFVALAVFFVVFYNTVQGIRAVDWSTESALRVLGASELELIRHCVAPTVRPHLVAALLIAAPQALLGAVIAEMLLGSGVGGLLIYLRGQFDTPGLYVATLVATVIGVLLNEVVGRFDRRYRLRASEAGL